jgi:hypothetical protein
LGEKFWTCFLKVDLRNPQTNAYALLDGTRAFILESQGRLIRGKVEKGFDIPSSINYLKVKLEGDT